MKLKKVLATILAAAMVLSTMSFSVFAEEADVWDGTSYSLDWLNGANPEEIAGDKFYLNSAEDLAGLANYVNNYAGTNHIFKGDTIYLNVDVDLDNHNWDPIGTAVPGEKNRFYGSFDGQGHTISNLKVAEGHYYAGLFGQIATYDYSQTFSNVTINNAVVVATDETESGKNKEAAGALIGRANGTIIENCHVTGEINISGDRFVGGLLGHSYAQISDCSVEASGTIKANTWQAGGLVGSHSATDTYISSVKNCSVIGSEYAGLNITSYYASVGGAIGAVSVSGVGSTTMEGITVANVSIAADSEDYGSGIAYVASGYTATKSTTGNVSATLGGEECVATDAGSVAAAVAEVDGTYYADFEADEAFAALKEGSVIKLLDDVTPSGEITLPENVTIQGNGKTINATVVASGDVTFEEYTKIKNFNAGYNKPTITIGEGATLEMTGTDRMVIGHGATFNITGDLVNAKTAHTQQYTPSLIIPGASFTGAGVNFNVTNAYIKTTASYCSSSKYANGSFKFNITNSIWEQSDKFAMEAQSVDATCDFNLVDSVMTTTSHLVFGLANGNVVIDNSNVNVGTSRQLENRGNMVIKNGSVVNGAIASSSNAINPGTITVDNATYAVTGEYTGAAEGRGKLILQNNAIASIGSASKADIEIDASSNLTVTAKLTNEATVKVNSGNLERGTSVKVLDAATNTKEEIEAITTIESAPLFKANFVGGDIEIISEPLSAMIGTEYYGSLKSALEAANDGDVITLLLDVADENFTVDKSVTIQSNTKVRSASKKTLNNVKFTMASGVEFTVKDLKFTGDSYINANEGAALTVTNCEADVDPARITGRSAFIVTGTAEPNNIPLKLVVTDNVILSAKSAGDYYGTAIFGWRYLADGTTISGNTFGSKTDRYNFVVVKTMNAMPDAKFVIENNKVYGTNKDYHFAAFDLYQNNSRDNAYTVVSKDNDIIVDLANDSNEACAFCLEGNGGTNVVVLENGSTLNNKKVGFEDFETSSLPSNYNKFYGIDVELDENGKIIAGKLTSIPDDSYLADGYVATLNPISNKYEVSGEELVANEISVVFEEVASGSEDEKLFNINLVATSNINEFASAEFTFVNTSKLNNGSVMPYVITAAENMTLTNPEKGYYGFAMDGVNKFEISENKITIGQVRFTGYGDIDFNVASGIVNATTVLNNLVKTYTTNGAVSGDITKGDLVINTGVIDTTIAVPTRTLKVNVAFPNAVVDNAAAYQAMKVEITGNIDGVNKTVTYDLGTDANKMVDGSYVIENNKLVLNNAYTVTVSGAGYRTARYTVTMTEDKVLKFWNNVMDEKQFVEIGKESSKVNVTFLAGDIVKDNNINIYDLSAVVSYFGTENCVNSYPEYAKYDLNRDGVIDSKDVAYVLVSWNN